MGAPEPLHSSSPKISAPVAQDKKETNSRRQKQTLQQTSTQHFNTADIVIARGD
jgi:hypothetical protein